MYRSYFLSRRVFLSRNTHATRKHACRRACVSCNLASWSDAREHCFIIAPPEKSPWLPQPLSGHPSAPSSLANLSHLAPDARCHLTRRCLRRALSLPKPAPSCSAEHSDQPQHASLCPPLRCVFSQRGQLSHRQGRLQHSQAERPTRCAWLACRRNPWDGSHPREG